MQSRFAIGSAVAIVMFFFAGRGLGLCDPLGDIENAALSTANAHSYHFTMSSLAIGNAQGGLLFPETLLETMPNGYGDDRVAVRELHEDERYMGEVPAVIVREESPRVIALPPS